MQTAQLSNNALYALILLVFSVFLDYEWADFKEYSAS